MANATIKEVLVPQPPVKEKRYVLELTKKEARGLRLICWKIGGLPEGLRGVSDAVGRALGGAGIPAPSQATVDTHVLNGMSCTREPFDRS